MFGQLPNRLLISNHAGVVVLAYAQTQIFEVYYFRMYMALVVGAAAHALVLLPVLLALVGPPPPPPHRLSDDNLSLQVTVHACCHLVLPFANVSLFSSAACS